MYEHKTSAFKKSASRHGYLAIVFVTIIFLFNLSTSDENMARSEKQAHYEYTKGFFRLDRILPK